MQRRVVMLDPGPSRRDLRVTTVHIAEGKALIAGGKRKDCHVAVAEATAAGIFYSELRFLRVRRAAAKLPNLTDY